ncbi:MAG: glycosyltransferase [Ignavibacteria bacterium]|nr:MAG: glycosyltransferase [Ignavibacteria bacterium]
MKILILSDPSSPHTIKWVNSLHRKGIEVFLFGLSRYDPTQYDDDIRIESLQTPDSIKAKLDGNFLKSMYLVAFPKLKKIIKDFKPDILHAHYAASYGLIGALTGFHPYFISVWGIDILTFPNNSVLHKKMIEYSLKKADKVLATSYFLAKKTNKYTNEEILITPFGIDIEKFRPKIVDPIFKENDIVIGTVKSMERKYGIEYLIKSFSIIKTKYQHNNLKLLLVGGGSLEDKFKQMIDELGITGSSILTGQIPFDKVADYHNQLSIAVYVSKVESFGVSILESSACGKPVVVSDVGGLPEVVENDVTGFIVKANDIEATTNAIEKLIHNKELREKLGSTGRVKVKDKFNWQKNVNDMINIYNQIVSN